MESRGLNLPKLANIHTWTCSPLGGTELSLVTLEAVPLSDPESAVPHVVQALYQPGCPPGLWGPVLAIPGVTSSQPCAVLPPLPHHPEATSLSLRVSRPCAWQRGFHAVAGHFRPDTSPEMTQRSDVPEDFRQEEGRGAFRGQLGLSRRRAWRAG